MGFLVVHCANVVMIFSKLNFKSNKLTNTRPSYMAYVKNYIYNEKAMFRKNGCSERRKKGKQC